MTDAQDRLRSIQTRLSQAQEQRARAAVEEENAQKAFDGAKSALAEQFGVVTGEDLKRVRAELEANLAKALDDLESALDTAGA